MSKTKADLERENAAQRDIIAALGEENDALRAIFTAAGEVHNGGEKDADWIIGYIRGIGRERSSISLLRTYARNLARAPRRGELAECTGEIVDAVIRCGYEYAIDGDVRYCLEDPGHDGDHLDDEGNVLPHAEWGYDGDLEWEAAAPEPQHPRHAESYIPLDMPTLAGPAEASRS